MATSSKGIRAGRAFVELFADDSRLVRGLKAAEAKVMAFGRSIQRIGKGMMALSAAVVAPLVASAKVFAKMGDAVAKMARRTGFSAESLSELGYAAELSGTNVEALENAIRRMQRTITDAQAGLSTAQRGLARFGLTAEQLAGLSPEEQFRRIADGLAAIADPTERASAAMEVFGRSGTALIPMLSRGSAGLDELQQQARKLGLTISKQDAEAAEKLTDAMSDMWRSLKQGVFVVGSALAPELKRAAEWMTAVAVKSADWLRVNKGLIVNLFKTAVAVGATGAAMLVLGKAITTVLGLAAALGGVKILGMTAIGTGVAYIAKQTEAGRKAIVGLADRFADLGSRVRDTYAGITDAMAGGYIALAGRILWLSLKQEWVRGVAGLQRVWEDFLSWISKAKITIDWGISSAKEKAVDWTTRKLLEAQAEAKRVAVRGNVAVGAKAVAAQKEREAEEFAKIDQWLADALKGAADAHAEKLDRVNTKFIVSWDKVESAHLRELAEVDAEVAKAIQDAQEQWSRSIEKARASNWFASAESAGSAAGRGIDEAIRDAMAGAAESLGLQAERAKGFSMSAGQELWGRIVESLGKGGDIEKKQLDVQQQINRSVLDQTGRLERVLENVGTFGA